MSYSGIDYGMGLANVDTKTGIRYGVISQHSLSDWINDVISDGAYYGEPTCGKCGDSDHTHESSAVNGRFACTECAELADDGAETCADCGQALMQIDSDKDYHCTKCAESFWSDFAFSEEMVGWSHEDDGYKLTDCLQNDVFVILSPYYTYAQFCSPCVPGAGNLDSPIENTFEADLPKVYCLGHDWFESGKAPYRVFRVSDGSEVLPETEEK